MKIKMLQDRFVREGSSLEKDKEYKVLVRAFDSGWIIEIQRPRSTRRAFVGDDECEVVKESLISKIKNRFSVQEQ